VNNPPIPEMARRVDPHVNRHDSAERRQDRRPQITSDGARAARSVPHRRLRPALTSRARSPGSGPNDQAARGETARAAPVIPDPRKCGSQKPGDTGLDEAIRSKQDTKDIIADVRVCRASCRELPPTPPRSRVASARPGRCRAISRATLARTNDVIAGMLTPSCLSNPQSGRPSRAFAVCQSQPASPVKAPNFASLMGEIMAGLAAGEDAAHDLELVRVGRFL
jgi:hypothetical protein